MEGVDGGEEPGGEVVSGGEGDVVLAEVVVESGGFMGVAGGIFAQGVIDIKLPRTFGEGGFG